jgi:ribosome-associated translation inhibitor RaiA
MSEQQQPSETKVNEAMTERVNKALEASDYTFLMGTTDHVVMISAGEENNKVDILMTLESMEEAVATLRSQADEEKPQ